MTDRIQEIRARCEAAKQLGYYLTDGNYELMQTALDDIPYLLAQLAAAREKLAERDRECNTQYELLAEKNQQLSEAQRRERAAVVQRDTLKAFIDWTESNFGKVLPPVYHIKFVDLTTGLWRGPQEAGNQKGEGIMGNYLTFERVLGSVKYGTSLRVAEAFTGERLFDRIWERDDRVKDFPSGILSAEVTSFSVDGNCLVVEIVRQEAEKGEAE